ncbi:MAG TPA: hypothetical protein VGB18_01515 [Candidatus Thermoplasmatota archaeon]
MTDATLRLDLFAGLLDQVREIIGEDSTCSMLHYAAAEEGRLLGAEAEGVDDLKQALARIEPLVGSKLEVVSEKLDQIEIRAPGFQARMNNRPVQAVLLGLLEGVLSQTRHRPYEGTLNGSAADGIVHLQPAKPKQEGTA